MNRRFTWLLLFSAAILVAGLYYTRSAWATKASGFTSTPITPFPSARLPQFEVFNRFVAPGSQGEDDDQNVWSSWQKTKGDSDLYVQNNVWQPGGSTGWHSHPGHSLIIVTAGTVTAYMGNDPSCTPHVYTIGTAFVDPGGQHVHIIRNESATDMAQTIAVQLLPAGQPRRIDVTPAPGNCPF
jgi:quercetin dioxygenase-like cupin family protein